MSSILPLADHLAPDCIFRLQQAAKNRFDEAEDLLEKKRYLAAVYLYGYSVEMCLSAASYRSAGLPPNVPIDEAARRRRMALARQHRLMNSDPHPLVGWARFLEWQKTASKKLSQQDSKHLKEAIHRAEQVYKHWRPELRYKTSVVSRNQLDEVRLATRWFIENRGRL